MQPRAIPKEVAVFKEAELPPDVINNTNQGGVFGGLAGQGIMFGSAGPAAATSTEGGGSLPHQAGR